jgi:hypothetical protein
VFIKVRYSDACIHAGSQVCEGQSLSPPADINPSADSSTSNSRQTGPAAADAARVAAGKQEEIDDEEEGQDDDDNQFRESTVHVGFTGPDPTTGLTAVRYIAPGVKLPPRDKVR